MPYRVGNRAWIHQQLGDMVRPEWNRTEKQWEIARPHMRVLVDALAERFGAVEVLIDFRINSRCDERCQNAKHDDCDCQCMGEHHGGSGYWKSWSEVGETTLVASHVAQKRYHVEERRWA